MASLQGLNRLFTGLQVLLALAIIALTTVSGQLVGISYATPRIGTAMAAILVVSVPIFSMIISRLWGLEPITPERIAGIVLGVLGIGMLVGAAGPALGLDGDLVRVAGAWLLVVFAVVMAGFLLAESIADAVAVRFLRFVGVNVLILLIADALSLAFVLGLKSWVERMANSNSPSPPAASHDTSRSPIRSPPPPPA